MTRDNKDNIDDFMYKYEKSRISQYFDDESDIDESVSKDRFFFKIKKSSFTYDSDNDDRIIRDDDIDEYDLNNLDDNNSNNPNKIHEAKYIYDSDNDNYCNKKTIKTNLKRSKKLKKDLNK